MGALGLLVIVLGVVKYFWWIAAAVVGREVYLWAQEQRELCRQWLAAEAAYHAELVARADQQHRWVFLGDERGLYGHDWINPLPEKEFDK